MTVLPDPGLAARRITDLYRHNLAKMGPDDIIVANVGGSGQSLIGNILFELGLNYADAYTEVFYPDGRAVAAQEHAEYRRHLASLYDKDQGTGLPAAALWPRFAKTHHPPVVFSEAVIGGVWILVRDPRDTLYAAWKWRAGFAEEELDRVPATFAEYLRGPGDYTGSPVDDWCAFYVAWTERARAFDRADVLRFDDLKQRPVEVVSAALRRMGLELPAAEVRRAVEASSFEKMREHEDQVAASRPDGPAQPRMVRSGKTEGWKAWMTPELAAFFTGDEVRTVARQFGYELPGPT